ncbi:glycoside hydrolase family 3 C-terminal domain-containing protein [uncultured Bacteroides sp.]|uniref:beta-glucosidase n=1 Tax=uncultured Bacteroides sp. TaxID=162156 RepID=UPI00259593E1|nr:glycoside hydrolase family 3 C-terminal domain-containing protein [uncultured Bacteroides sp.]
MKMKSIVIGTLFLIGANSYAQHLTLKADNIDRIVKELTLEEKARLLVGRENSKSKTGVPGAAGTTQGVERLGIPGVVLTDGPAGVRISPIRKGDSQTYYATGFPVGTALACTWNPELVENVGKAIGEETLEYGCDVLLAPGMNIQRTPLCGRNFEYFSEDPVVSGIMAAAYVNGVQSNGVGTSIKHYAVNSQETNRIEVDEIVSQRALRELYLKGFEIAIRKSNPWTVMSSYNRLNGTWTQSSPELLITILCDEWKYDGLVMTDWTNERRTSYDRVAAGNELLAPGHDWQETDIIENVKKGNLSMDIVDARVKRLLEMIVKTPRFKGYKFSNKPDLEAHAALTRQASTEGMILLENKDNTLPLKGVKTVALFGKTSYDFIAGGTGSGDVNKPYVIDLMTGLSNAGLTINEDLKQLYRIHKDFNDKANKVSGERKELTELKVSRRSIERLAASNDLAIFTIGRQAGEGRDRHIDNDFNLTTDEREMLEDICNAFHALGKKVVVIMNMGSVMETASWKEMPDALLMAWQPGQEGGNSVADVLLGKQTPSGKLTMTFPIMASDVPAVNNFPTGTGSKHGDRRRNVDYTLHEEGIYVGYRYFTTFGKKVSYPFGYGLSYTTFAYSKPVVKATANGFTASIVVKNTGNVDGKEAVQLYVAAPNSGLDKPVRELKAFAKTGTLKPGESETLHFHISTYDLASFNEAESEWQTATGKYEVQFGASVEDIRATATFNNKKMFSSKTNNVLRLNRELKEIKP